jgi:hypothetical protein
LRIQCTRQRCQRFQALVRVRDHQLDAFQAAPVQAFEEDRPEGFGLWRSDVQADDLALAIGVCGHSDYCRDADDAPAFALFEVGGIEPQIGPFALQRPFEEGIHPLVDVLAQLADGAFADAAQPHGLHQVLDAAGGDAADPGFLDHRDQGFLWGFARLQEGRKVAALAQLRYPQLKRAKAGVEAAVAKSVAVGGPLAGAFMAGGADQTLDVGFHQHLHDCFSGAAQEVRVPGFGEKLDKG